MELVSEIWERNSKMLVSAMMNIVEILVVDEMSL